MKELSFRDIRILFHNSVVGNIKKIEMKNRMIDIPLRRESWISFIDHLVKSGVISEEAAINITAPKWVNGK